MTFRYTLGNWQVFQFVLALARCRGTGAHRRLWVLRAVGLLAGLISLWFAARQNPYSLAALAAAALLLLAAIWLVTWAVYLVQQLLALSLSGQKRLLLGDRTVTLEQGWYRHKARGGQGGSFERPWAQIAQLRPAQGGLLVLFADKSADFIPAAGLADQGGAQLCRQKLQGLLADWQAAHPVQETPAQAADPAARQQAPAAEAPAPEQAFGPLGFFAGEEPGPVLRFVLEPQQVPPLLAECARALYRSKAYWRSQRVWLICLLAVLVLGVAEGNAVFLAIPVLTAVLLAYQAWQMPRRMQARASQGGFSAMAGPQSLRFGAEGLTLTRRGESVELAWAALTGFYETEHCYCLLQKKPLGLVPVPKSALPEGEMRQAFLQALEQRLQKG